MSLRDDLLAKLDAVDDLGDFSHACPYSVRAAIADECLRQMEWAYEEALGTVSEPGRDWLEHHKENKGKTNYLGVIPQYLTLAPEGWKP